MWNELIIKILYLKVNQIVNSTTRIKSRELRLYLMWETQKVSSKS